MGETLESLYRLQRVERQLAQFRLRREEKLRQIDSRQLQLRKTEDQLEQNKELALRRQVRLDAMELDVASREEAVEKHREALNKAKTNKEYAAILTAMNTEKADNAKIETEILKLMEEIERFKREEERIQSEKEKLEDAVRQRQEELERIDEDCKRDVDQLKKKRDTLAQQVEPTPLGIFTRVAAHHEGEAMVPLEKIHPKRDDYICSGCNMKVTLEVVNALSTRNVLELCKICGRILYIENPAMQGTGA